MVSAVDINSVSKSYGNVDALRAVNLSVDEGQYVVLLGPSGSGKTTLLSILGGFQQPTTGHVQIHGKNVTMLAPADRPTATVFQDYALFPHMTVRRNIAFGMRMHGAPKAKTDDAVDRMLDLVGLSDYGDRRIDQMSGGQRQRIALARALIIEPVVLLLDEPLGALDLHLRRRMQDELHRLQRQIGSIFIHVTHDQEEAMSLADTVVVMRDGQIEDQGSPRRVYMEPATCFAATFMGSSNLLPGRIASASDHVSTVETPFGQLDVPNQGTRKAEGQQVHVSLRPEHLKLKNGGMEPYLTKGRVNDLVFHGTHMRLSVQPEFNHDFELIVAASADSDIAIGTEVSVVADMNKAVVLSN